jgi:hypothetical protein
MTRRQLTDPFGSDDEDERFVSKWMRLSNTVKPLFNELLGD